jgi:hypothetical protein
MRTRLLIGLYLVLSTLDYICTALLCHFNNCNIEGNPVAAVFIARFGLIGMAVFKCVTVTILFTMLVLLGYFERGKKYIVPLLVTGNTLVFLTVCYSIYLLAMGRDV